MWVLPQPLLLTAVVHGTVIAMLGNVANKETRNLAPNVGYTVFWREKPEHVFSTAPRDTCGCVHHAAFDTIARSLPMIRKELHTPAGGNLGRLHRGSS